MSPGQGSGAGQAVEDAYILASLLAHKSTTRETLPIALKVYEEIRLPHANDVSRRSDLSSALSSFGDPRFSALADKNPDGSAQEADAGKLWEMGHALVDNWRWAWTTSVDDDEKQAITLLEERLAKVPNF
jgi:salicylate hydroxylase